MIRLHTLWLIPTVMLIGFGTGAAPAPAQTTYPFSANYDILATANDLTPNLEQISLLGSSTDALYGLTQLNSLTYSQTDFTTGSFSFNTDPAAFGLKDVPLGSVVFAGNGSDRLFGTESATGLIDFSTLTVNTSGTLNITGGAGKFSGATGTLAFSQVQPLSLQVGVALKGQAKVSGSFQTVPEPRTATTLIGMGAIGAIFLRRRPKLQGTSS